MGSRLAADSAQGFSLFRLRQAVANRGGVVVCLLGFVVTTQVWAQDVAFSAKVDKSTVKIGEPITLTISLSGDVSGVQLPSFEFPEGFAVLGRSQSTSFSIRAGVVERSTGLNFVLMPQRAGTFQLGPFAVTHQRKTLQTESITITVKKPAVPPFLGSNGERFTL